MKRLFLLLAFLCLTFASAQTNKQDAKKQSQDKNSVQKKSDAKKAAKSKNATYSKAGKTDPNEKGSGMTVPDQDKPKLDERPNPAATVPATQIPSDSGNPTRRN
ncbi:hypothetical protein [Flavobacterium sp.]|uniref:hypothetical protein n=1 Tax=Flavobacterium sp. TaxID=239 RepID=UPI00121449ED|nr:hypothetical protein [Flavobacterium sp.]RZJ71109.1 MAG: hypothetical protein EOO49_11705 [Flavobacterium sp.]